MGGGEELEEYSVKKKLRPGGLRKKTEKSRKRGTSISAGDKNLETMVSGKFGRTRLKRRRL